jgi:Bacterial AMP nucleoside phosphorylase N-terminus
MSVATPGTDFTAPERDFAALIRAAGFCRSGLDRVCPAGLYVSATHEITLMPDNILSPKRITAEAFTDTAPAVARLAEIYERNVSFLRTAFEAYVGGEPLDTRAFKA